MAQHPAHLNKIILTLILALSLPLVLDAQSFYALRRDRNFLVNLGTGTSHYFGEMVNPGDIGRTRPNVAVGAEMYLTSRFSVRSELTWFQLTGNDADANDDRITRNLSFRSNCLELAALGVMNLTPMGLRFYQRSFINFHVFGGVAGLYHNPRAKYNGEWVALRPLQTENVPYSRVQFVIPFGLGARVKLNPFFNILVEAGYRYTFTDYLDDASSRRYVDVNKLKVQTQEARDLSDRRVIKPANPSAQGRRGNPDRNDGYFMTNITLQYYLPVLVFGDSYRKLYNVKRKAYYRKPGGR